MTVKMSWGRKLTAEELKEREQRFHDNCNKLEAEVRQRLEGLAVDVTIAQFRPICHDCPEKPGECSLCRVDEVMCSHFERAGVTVLVQERSA